MSRLEKLKEQHPKLNVSLIDIISKADPTKTYKYCDFLIRIISNMMDSNSLFKAITEGIFTEENLKLISKFESHCAANRIENSDITSYNDFIQIELAVKNADEILQQKELEKQVIKLYDSNEWIVIIPQTFEASKVYGSNTKWCTTSVSHWENYSIKYTLIYVINRKTNQKYAISQHNINNNEIKGWMQNDLEINPLLLPIPSELILLIINELKKEKTTIVKRNPFDGLISSDAGGDVHDMMRRMLGNHRSEQRAAEAQSRTNGLTAYPPIEFLNPFIHERQYLATDRMASDAKVISIKNRYE